MKCDKTITQATAVDNTVKVFVCNGEMIEVFSNYSTCAEYKIPFKLYQCESCKTIKLC